MRRQPLELGPGVVGERVGARRVQRDRGVDARVPLGGPGRPPRRGQIVGDGDDGLHPDRLGPVQDRAHVVGVRGAAGVEVGVRVDQRGRAAPAAAAPLVRLSA